MGLLGALFGGGKKKKPTIRTKVEIIEHQHVAPDEPEPVEKRIRSLNPGPSGLYPHEILMLHYAQGYKTSIQEFQGFWRYKYGVRDPKGVLTSLMQRGYLKTGGAPEAMRNAKMDALRDCCRQAGLSPSGKKDTLIERLVESADASLLEATFSDKYFALTELGGKALDAEGYIPYIHLKPIDGLDIWNVGGIVNAGQSPFWRDAMWGYMNKESIGFASAGNYGLYANMRLRMSEFVEDEGRIKDALRLAVEVECIDLNGAVNGGAWAYMADKIAPYKDSLVKSAPGIIKRIFKLAKQADYNDERLDALILEIASRRSTPVQIFTPEECVRIVHAEKEGNTALLGRLYSKAQKRLKGEA